MICAQSANETIQDGTTQPFFTLEGLKLFQVQGGGHICACCGISGLAIMFTAEAKGLVHTPEYLFFFLVQTT